MEYKIPKTALPDLRRLATVDQMARKDLTTYLNGVAGALGIEGQYNFDPRHMVLKEVEVPKEEKLKANRKVRAAHKAEVKEAKNAKRGKAKKKR